MGCLALHLNPVAQQGDRRGEIQPSLPTHIQPPDAPVRSAADAASTLFSADPRLKVILFASEPLVEDPVAVDFDSKGRLWVVEMRGYMLDLKGQGEDLPSGRVRILEDTNHDGVADHSKIFLDDLIMPRALRVLPDGVLVASGKRLVFYQDTNGDDIPEKSEVVDEHYVTGGNPEHQPNGLLYGLDNWIYSAKSAWRYRQVNGQWVRDRTEFRGQWGIAHDGEGRLYYNINYSQLHVDLIPPNYKTRNPWLSTTNGLNVQITEDQRIFTLRPNPGVNRGYRPGILDERGYLTEFTSASAPLIYRSDYLPEDYIGNAFVCEPAANLIKRNILTYGDMQITSRFAWDDAEFLVSTDERFRPVNIAQAPDGSIVVVDFYRGVVQHKQYMTTHLRNQIEQRGLQKGLHYGRIWKIVRRDANPVPPDPIAAMDTDELLGSLGSPNAWIREKTQQQLIVAKESIPPSRLVHILPHTTSSLQKIHILWTLEGILAKHAESTDGIHQVLSYKKLNVEDLEIMLGVLNDPDLNVVLAATRVLEKIIGPFNPLSDPFIDTLIDGLLSRESRSRRVQSALSMGRYMDLPQAREKMSEVMVQSLMRYPDDGLLRSAVLSSVHQYEFDLFKGILRYLSEKPDSVGRFSGVIEDFAHVLFRSRNTPDLLVVANQLAEIDDIHSTLQKAFWSTLLDMKSEFIRHPLDFAQQPAGVLEMEFGQSLKSLMKWPGNNPSPSGSSVSKRVFNASEKAHLKNGQSLYLVACASCHGQEGEGLPNLAPPLMGSDWLQKDPSVLARIVLHGMEGPIRVNDKSYRPPSILPNMPAVGALDDSMLADILSYVRIEFGFHKHLLTPDFIRRVREDHAERDTPWTEEDFK